MFALEALQVITGLLVDHIHIADQIEKEFA
jgi:hypothetical protein